MVKFCAKVKLSGLLEHWENILSLKIELLKKSKPKNNMKNKNNEFSQVCVWPGTVVGNEKEQKEFEAIMKKQFGVRVQYLEEIKTAPDFQNGCPVKDTGNRSDLFFAVHNEDVGKFAIPRLQVGIRWIEDVLANEGKTSLYPKSVKKYKTW